MPRGASVQQMHDVQNFTCERAAETAI